MSDRGNPVELAFPAFAAPTRWSLIPLKYVLPKLESGVSVNAADRPVAAESIGVLKTSCVYHDNFDPEENKEVVPEADTHIQQAAIANSLENFKYVFDKALEGKFIDRMDQNQEIFARYMNDPAFAKLVADVLRKQVYEQIRTEAKSEAVSQQ